MVDNWKLGIYGTRSVCDVYLISSPNIATVPELLCISFQVLLLCLLYSLEIARAVRCWNRNPQHNKIPASLALTLFTPRLDVPQCSINARCTSRARAAPPIYTPPQLLTHAFYFAPNKEPNHTCKLRDIIHFVPHKFQGCLSLDQ